MAQALSQAGLTDCHCHLLPFLDDGPETMEVSVRMAGVLASLGFRAVYCTPHLIRGAYDNAPGRVRQAVSVLQEELDRAGIALRLVAGLEYHLDEFLSESLGDPLLLPNSLLLVEAPSQILPDRLLDAVYQIKRRSYTPLLAHPERCLTLAEDQGLVQKLRAQGCLFQGNIGSFAGHYGSHAKNSAVRFLRTGVYDRLGTDAHGPEHLERIITDGLNEVRETVGQPVLEGLLKEIDDPQLMRTKAV